MNNFTSHTINLSNTQCPDCKTSRLRQVKEDMSIDVISGKSIVCEKCGRFFDVIWGVPYLGIFKQDEILSLIEIAAVSDVFTIRNKENILDYLSWIKLIEEYCLSSAPEQVLHEHNITQKPDWFENRCSEHKWFHFLTSDIQLSGKQALDVGAATGYDSLKLSNAGATVTALEFNPILAGIGLYNFPHLRWIGGAAHNLPFADEQFDIVIANAALHHFIDIPQSVSEMLRVLKKGGYLITISDSFSNDATTEEQESHIFNNACDVLTGVNEQVPRFKVLVETFKSLREHIGVRIFTQGCHNHADYPHEWQVDEAYGTLPKVGGSISFLVQKKSSITAPQPEIGAEIITPADYAQGMENGSSGISVLADNIPEKFLDLPLFGNDCSKFRLLNGWKLYLEGDDKRAAYSRARMFFSIRKTDSAHVAVSILVPYVSDCDSPKMVFRINNRDIYEKDIYRGMWNDLLIPIRGKIDSKKAFSFEIQLKTELHSADAKLFYIRKIEFTDDRNFEKKEGTPELEYFGLESLVYSRSIGPLKTCVMLSTDYENGLSTVNKIRKSGLHVDMVVARGQEPFYAWLPDTTIVDSYPDPNFDRKDASFHLTTGVQLIAARDIGSAKYLYGLVSESNMSSKIYLILPGGHATLCEAGLFRDSVKKVAGNLLWKYGTRYASIIRKVPLVRNFAAKYYRTLARGRNSSG